MSMNGASTLLVAVGCMPLCGLAPFTHKPSSFAAIWEFPKIRGTLVLVGSL